MADSKVKTNSRGRVTLYMLYLLYFNYIWYKIEAFSSQWYILNSLRPSILLFSIVTLEEARVSEFTRICRKVIAEFIYLCCFRLNLLVVASDLHKKLENCCCWFLLSSPLSNHNMKCIVLAHDSVFTPS